MVKQPVAGRVKTRLGEVVGPVAATGFYRHTASALLHRLAADTRWQTLLSVAPDHAVASGAWPARVSRVPQRAGDLGHRMQRIFLGLPPGPVIIIGTDVPAIRPDLIWRAFRQLGDHDIVFGPAADGGFWLVGQARVPAVCTGLFDRVRWSTAHALADTRANTCAHDCGEVATLCDVDDAATFRTVQGWAGRRILPSTV